MIGGRNIHTGRVFCIFGWFRGHESPDLIMLRNATPFQESGVSIFESAWNSPPLSLHLSVPGDPILSATAPTESAAYKHFIVFDDTESLMTHGDIKSARCNRPGSPCASLQ